LLPLVKNDENYLPFESRKFQREGATHLGQLVSRWLDEVFDLNGEVFPFVALPHQHQRFGQMIKNSLGRTGHARLAAVSFGTGGNDRKRISDELEHKLVDHLLTERAVILDKGATQGEREQIDCILASLREQGRIVVEINEQNASE